MTHSIESLAVSDGADIYYSDKWLSEIEAHVLYLQTSSKTKVMEIPVDRADRYRTDPVGLFDSMAFPRYLHQVLLRVNGWNLTTEIKDLRRMLVPDTSEIEAIRLKLSSTYNRATL